MCETFVCTREGSVQKNIKVCDSVIVFNATFNNISVISWQSVLLAEEIRISGENYQSVTGHRQNDIMLYQVHLAWAGFQLTTLVVIGTDCTGSCKSNNHTITTTTAPLFFLMFLRYLQESNKNLVVNDLLKSTDIMQ